MKARVLQWLGFILILETGLLHLLTAQAEYEEAAYLGYLFAANFFGALVAAFGIHFKQRWGWMLGLVISAGSIAGYVWSRTFGMPGMTIEEWYTPYGVVAVLVESAFLVIFLLRPWNSKTGQVIVSSGRYFVPVAALIVLVGGFVTARWDEAVAQSFGHHVGSLDQVCSTDPTSLAELEDVYGVRVSLVATSMMNSIVDVRIQIVDPGKAHALLQNQAALLVGQQALILAPHMHSHTGPRLKAGRIFTIFFPTEQIITKGSEVSLVFGPVRLEPVVVQ